MKMTTARKVTISLGVLLVVIGLLFHTGTGTLSSFGWEQIAAICPLGAIEVFLASNLLIPPAVIAFVLMAIGILLLGKVFCAWLCPIPPLKSFFTSRKKKEAVKQELAKEQAAKREFFEKGAERKATEEEAKHGLAEKSAAKSELSAGAGIKNEHVSGEAKGGFINEKSVQHELTKKNEAQHEPSERGPEKHKPAKKEAPTGTKTQSCASDCKSTGSCSSCHQRRARVDSRHLILGGTLLTTAAFGFPVFCLVCPIGLSFATIIAVWRFVGFSELTLSLLVFPAILLIEIVVLRRWCHKFCPLGAAVSLLSLPNRFFRPVVDRSKCIRSKGGTCNICANVCEELLDPHYRYAMNECTKCGVCKEQCPVGAIHFAFLPRRDAYDAPESAAVTTAPVAVSVSATENAQAEESARSDAKTGETPIISTENVQAAKNARSGSERLSTRD